MWKLEYGVELHEWIRLMLGLGLFGRLIEQCLNELE